MLTLNSPAKINWFLRVTGRRSDGYHSICSVMQPVGLYDTIVLERRREAIEIESDLNIPLTENLVYRAALLFKEFTGKRAGVRISLTKRIPLQGGLGGGSSNAATTLIGLNTLWNTDIPVERLARLSSPLGSDVPFFIYGTASFVEGRGEVVKPLGIRPSPLNLLIVKPDFGVPTSTAYKNVSHYRECNISSVARITEALKTGQMHLLSPLLENDLEEPVYRMYPLLGSLKQRMIEGGALAALLCGSGSSVFGLFQDRKSAEESSSDFGDMWTAVTETI